MRRILAVVVNCIQCWPFKSVANFFQLKKNTEYKKTFNRRQAQRMNSETTKVDVNDLLNSLIRIKYEVWNRYGYAFAMLIRLLNCDRNVKMWSFDAEECTFKVHPLHGALNAPLFYTGRMMIAERVECDVCAIENALHAFVQNEAINFRHKSERAVNRLAVAVCDVASWQANCSNCYSEKSARVE